MIGLLFVFILVSSANCLTLYNNLRPKDNAELQKVFLLATQENNLASIYFGLAGQKLLNDKFTDTTDV